MSSPSVRATEISEAQATLDEQALLMAVGPSSRRGAWIAAAAMVVLGLTVLGANLARGHDFIGTIGDEQGYNWRAENLVLHGVYAKHWNNGKVDYSDLDLPGYPLFLAGVYLLTGIVPACAVLVQVLLSGLTVALAYSLAADAAGPRAGAAAAAFLIGELSVVLYANTLMTESLTAMLITLAVWLSVRSFARQSWVAWAALASGILGYAVMVRPACILAGPVLGMGSLFSGRGRMARRAVLGIVLCLGTLLSMGAWTMRNRAIFGDTGANALSPQAGMLRYSAEAVLAECAGPQSVEALRRDRARILAAGANPLTSSEAVSRLYVRVLTEHKLAAMKYYALNCAKTLAAPANRLTQRMVEPSSWGSVVGWVVWPLWLVCLLLGLYGVTQGCRQQNSRQLVLTALLLIAYVIAISGLYGQARYRVPVVPLATVLGGIGFASLPGGRKSTAE